MIIKGLILAALVRLLIATDKPLLCASLYGFVVFAFGFLSIQTGQATYMGLLVSTAIALGLSSLYFILLSKSEGGAWWVVFILGILVFMFI
jgi:hypothetical protein